VASLSQGRTAAAQCGLFTHKSVPVIFEPPCIFPTPPSVNKCQAYDVCPWTTHNSHYNLKFTEFNHVYSHRKMVFLLMRSISYSCSKTFAGHRHKSSWLWVVISGIHGPQWKDSNSDNDPRVTKIVANGSVDCGRWNLILRWNETALPPQALAYVFVKWVLSNGLATEVFSPQHRCQATNWSERLWNLFPYLLLGNTQLQSVSVEHLSCPLLKDMKVE